jgi:malate synthase
MECRKEAKRRYSEGALPGFDPATRYIREGEWTCAPVPPAVADRKVEITGPVERKMIINALNSGAKVFMVSLAVLLLYSWKATRFKT